MRRVRLTLGPLDAGVDGYPMMLELIDSLERASATLPRATIEDRRPDDDAGEALDEYGIHALLLRAAPVPSLGELQRVGDYLGELLFFGSVGEKLAQLRKRFPREAPPQTEGLGVLLDITAPNLRVLPWELTRSDGVWMSTDPANPWARISSNFDPDPPPEPDWWPLRVTVIVGAEADDQVVKVEQELENLYAALDKVGPDVEYKDLQQPPRGEFLPGQLQRLKPHVLHFIGHGESDGATGVLVMNDEEGRWDWSAEQIRATMPVTPRIAVLNACRSGDLRPRSDTPQADTPQAGTPQAATWQVADAFMQLGAHAVLAMQGDIDGGAAAAFSAGLYLALIDNATIDVAVARGRQRVLERAHDRRDFCLPTLTLSRLPERVLPRRLGIERPRLNIVDLLLPPQPFIDRTDDRRALLEYLDRPAGERVALTSIEGDPNVGKTSLGKWALRQLAVRGRSVVYVDLKNCHAGDEAGDDQPCSAIDVLRAIRDAVHDAAHLFPGTQTDGRRPFDAWTQALNHLVQGRPVPATVPEFVIDEGAQFGAHPAELEDIFRRFLDVLRSLGQPVLLLALDHVEAVDVDDFRDDVFHKLIKPIVLNPTIGIELLLAGLDVTDLLRGLRPGCAVRLTPFPPGEMPLLVRQYLRYHDDWTPERVQSFAPVIDREWNEPARPEELEEFRQWLGKFR
jgi:hypothetical protein